MKSRKDIILVIASAVLLLSGIFLFSETNRLHIIHLVNGLLHSHMDEHFRSIGLGYLSTWLILSGICMQLFIVWRRNQVSEKIFIALCATLVLVHYGWYLVSNAVNFPLYDDHRALLDFMVKYSDAQGIREKIALICAPYNESVIIVPKLFSLLWFKIFGSLNFMHLLIFNGLVLIMLFAFLFRKSSAPIQRLLFVSLAVFVFQFQFFDDAFWVLSGLCFYFSFLFAALSFHFLKKKTVPGTIVSLLFSLLASFTFGNGWLVIVVNTLFLISEKRNNEFWLWMALLALVSIALNRVSLQMQPLSAVNFNVVENMSFIILMLGSGFQFFYSPVLPAVIGLFILGSFVFLIYKKQIRSSPVLFQVLAFLVLSSVLAAPFRSGIETMGMYGLHVRYGIFSILAFVLTISLLASYQPFKPLAVKILVIAAFGYHAATGIFFYPEVVIRKENMEKLKAGLKQNIFDDRYSLLPKNDYETLMRDAMKKNIYRP